MTALSQFNKNDKEFGITDGHKLANEDTLGYIATQVNEMKAILTRLRVDIFLNQVIAVDGKSEKAARDKKIDELRADVDQFVESINALSTLRDELKKELSK